jgi:ribose transport system ATP-binding protein
MENSVVLEMKGIGKSFPGVKALDNVNFKLKKGSVHALLGENGAGKSTLMKILSGVYTADEGEIFVKGELNHFENTMQSQEKGVSIIHQELNLCWNLSVAENILLCREITGKLGNCKRKEMNAKVEDILKRLGVDHIRADQLVDELSIANQQMVEIAKAISIDADILIMDEPTSSLTKREEKMLFKIIKNLQTHGVSIIYISHKLEEIFEICDEVTVIRDGVWINTLPIEEATHDHLIELMVGRSIDMIYPESKADGSNDVVFEVRNLQKHGLVDDISFKIRKGEILGVSGLVGAGRTEMAKTIFGRWEKDAGRVFLRGEEITIKSPQDALKHGIAFVTEDRKKEGLNLLASVKDNIMSSNLDLVSGFLGLVDGAKEKTIAADGIKKLRVKTPGIETPVKSLSGGNQQKLIISRWLVKNVKVFILDEPTRGIDVGAKAEIYDLIRMLAEQGIAVIMISSELPEIIGMSDRIAVMHGGRIMKVLDKVDTNQEEIMRYATGGVQ